MKKLFLLISLVLFLEPFTSAQSNILKKNVYSIDDLKKFCIEDFNQYMNHGICFGYIGANIEIWFLKRSFQNFIDRKHEIDDMIEIIRGYLRTLDNTRPTNVFIRETLNKEFC